MTPEQIAAIKQEIESFSQKSIQFATDNPVLSAHYNRLFRASQSFLDKAVKLEQAAARKKHTEARKQAKEAAKNGGTGARPSVNQTRQSA